MTVYAATHNLRTISASPNEPLVAFWGVTAITGETSPQSGDEKTVTSKDNGETLDDLKQRITAAEGSRDKQETRNKRAGLPAEAAALLGRVATEMVAGLVVGGSMGWALDYLLGTSPIFMIVMFFMGAAAGMMNIWRMAMGHGLKVGYFDRKTDESDGQDRTG